MGGSFALLVSGLYHYITSKMGRCGSNSPLAEHTTDWAICVSKPTLCAATAIKQAAERAAARHERRHRDTQLGTTTEVICTS